MAHKLLVIARVELSSLPIKEILHLVKHEFQSRVISQRRDRDEEEDSEKKSPFHKIFNMYILKEELSHVLIKSVQA